MAKTKGKQKVTTIRASWLAAFPRRGWSPTFWLKVRRRVDAEGVAHNDLARVKQICEEVDATHDSKRQSQG